MSAKAHSEISLRKSKSVEELKALLVEYAPNKQIEINHDKERCYFGNIPTLAEINRIYDKQAAVAWLIPQLTNLAEFSNCKTSFSEMQIRECAEMIVSEYSYLKLSELMLFFYRFKCGVYEKFYGSVSPMTIMASLLIFLEERRAEIKRLESERTARAYKESLKQAIPYEEYLKRKKSHKV